MPWGVRVWVSVHECALVCIWLCVCGGGVQVCLGVPWCVRVWAGVRVPWYVTGGAYGCAQGCPGVCGCA